MTDFEWELYLVKFTNLEKMEDGEFYLASDSFINAALAVNQSLTDDEFVNSIERLGSVDFTISDDSIEKIYKRKMDES